MFEDNRSTLQLLKYFRFRFKAFQDKSFFKLKNFKGKAGKLFFLMEIMHQLKNFATKNLCYISSLKVSELTKSIKNTVHLAFFFGIPIVH